MKIMFTDVILVCPFCGKEHSVSVTPEGCEAWLTGKPIQNAMPFLSTTEREQLVSHLCPKCQEGLFYFDDEDEDCEPPDIDDDCGFDPYMGCYSDDC